MPSQYLPPNPEALAKVSHIVVLMLENHSFDHMLGWLYDDPDAPLRDQDFDGLRDDFWNPLDSLDSNGVAVIEKVPVKKNGAPIKGTKFIKADPDPSPDFCLPHPDPGEGFKDTNQQLFQTYEVPNDYPPEPTNFGFVNNYVNTIVNGTYRIFGGEINDPRTIMTTYTPGQLPVLSKLACEFAVCDHWYASVPSQTLPNRNFFHAATSCGQVNNKPQPTCDAPTIYNRLEEAGVSWTVYVSSPNVPGDKNPKDSLTEDRQHFSLTRLTLTQLHPPSLDGHFRAIDHFYQDAKCGELPAYSFLEPQYSGHGQNDQHPPSDVRPGEQLIADVYNAVRESPGWEQTLLVITYDEHGGCFDHVPPPGGAAPPEKGKPPGQFGFAFNRFGVRVPTVLISPYIKPNTVCRPHGWPPFDHTSIIKTVRNRFGLTEQLTERDGAAPDVSCVLNLLEPRTDRVDVCPQSCEPPIENPQPNDLNTSCAEILVALTGEIPASGESTHDFNHRTYWRHFGGRGEDT